MNADRLARLTARNGTHGRDKHPHDALPEGLEPWQPGVPEATQAAAPNGSALAAEPATAGELEQLRQENGELRQSAAQLRELLEQAQAQEESWGRREREYKSLLEEKSEVI